MPNECIVGVSVSVDITTIVAAWVARDSAEGIESESGHCARIVLIPIQVFSVDRLRHREYEKSHSIKEL